MTQLERIMNDIEKLRELRDLSQRLPAPIQWMPETNEQALINWLQENWQAYCEKYRNPMLLVWVLWYMDNKWDGRGMSWALFESLIGNELQLIVLFGFLLDTTYNYENIIRKHADELYCKHPRLGHARMVGGPGSRGSVLWEVDDPYPVEAGFVGQRVTRFSTKQFGEDSFDGTTIQYVDILRPNTAIDSYIKNLYTGV